LPFGLIDLRRIAPGGEWLGKQLIARPFSYKEVLALWPRHLDAFLVLRDLEPVRRVREP